MLTIRLIHAFVYKECIVYKSASHFVTKVPECLIKAVIISKSRTLVNGALLDGKNAVDVNGSIRKSVLDLFHFHTVGVNKSRGITFAPKDRKNTLGFRLMAVLIWSSASSMRSPSLATTILVSRKPYSAMDSVIESPTITVP